MVSALTEAKKLTSDPGVHYLANLIDQLQARLDLCCPPTSIKAGGSTADDTTASEARSGAKKTGR